MTDTPPDWVLIEAAKRSEWTLKTTDEMRKRYRTYNPTFHALCDMIQKYEQPPVDRKLLCAREAWREFQNNGDVKTSAEITVRAIELWEEGFGK